MYFLLCLAWLSVCSVNLTFQSEKTGTGKECGTALRSNLRQRTVHCSLQDPAKLCLYSMNRAVFLRNSEDTCTSLVYF